MLVQTTAASLKGGEMQIWVSLAGERVYLEVNGKDVVDARVLGRYTALDEVREVTKYDPVRLLALVVVR